MWERENLMAGHAIQSPDDANEPSPVDAFGALRRLMIATACFTATVATALIYDVLPPIMGDLARHFGGGTTGGSIAQMAGALPLFGVMAAALLSGPAIERFGLRPTLLASMALFAIAGSSGVSVDLPWLFLLGRLLTGAGAGLMTTACSSLIVIYYRGAARTRMNGMIVGAGSVAAIVFVLVAGFAATFWWRGPFLMHAAVVLAFVPAVLLVGPVPESPAPEGGMMGNLRRLAPMGPVCLVGFLWFVAMLMGSIQSPFVMVQSGVADHRVIATIFALNAAAVAISSVVAGRVAPRFHTTTVLCGSFLLLGASLCIIGAGTTALHFALGLIVSGISVGFGLTALWTWGMRCAPQDIVPRSLGAMTTCLYLGGALSPVLTAPYHAMLGLRGQFYGVAATIAIAVALVGIARRLPRRQSAA